VSSYTLHKINKPKLFCIDNFSKRQLNSLAPWGKCEIQPRPLLGSDVRLGRYGRKGAAQLACVDLALIDASFATK